MKFAFGLSNIALLVLCLARLDDPVTLVIAGIHGLIGTCVWRRL